MEHAPITHRPILHLLDHGERIELFLRTGDNELRVTDRRLVVTQGDGVRLHVGYDELRRIEFDLETMRPGVMILVPHHANLEPQIMTIPRKSLHYAADVLAFIGDRLA